MTNGRPLRSPRFFNVHIHTFTSRAAHSKISRLIPIIRTRPGAAMVGWLLRSWVVRKLYRNAERVAAFASIGRKKTQVEIYEFVRGFYPEGTRFVVLALDMDRLADGLPPQPYEDQLRELLTLTTHPVYGAEVIPFFSADARRPGVTDLFKRHVEAHGFRGVKLYPPIGYYPCDPRLTDIYRYAADHDLPVLSHCSRGGVYFKGTITEAMRIHPRTGNWIGERNPKKFTELFTDPGSYRVILEEHPALRVCLAHYGGGEEWEKHVSNPWTPGNEKTWVATINEMLTELVAGTGALRYPNLYVDVSATAADPRTHGLMKVLIEDDVIGRRILYGSDYYMIQRQVTEREFSLNFRAFIGEENFKKIAIDNPKRFLGGGVVA